MIETSVYTDDSFPFSSASRKDVLAAMEGEWRAPWQGNQDENGANFEIEGLEPLYNARDRLDRQTVAGKDLFLLESCIAATAVYLVIRRTVLEHGRRAGGGAARQQRRLSLFHGSGRNRG